MADVPPTPARVVIPLRRDNQADQCPDVDRCLLELVREPAPDLLEVIDTGLPSPALNRATTKQVVQAKLIAARRSCHRDYTVRVSLLSAGGPIAIGEGRERTTTVRTRRIYTVSSSVISDTTTTATERVAPDTATGTTTDVQTIDHGDGTETTTTTTITVRAIRWERRLRGCIDPPQVWLPAPPAHLLCSRYPHHDGAVSLVVLQATTGSWHVVVERTGHTGALHLVYSPMQDDLQVSAALSSDLRSLYLAESRRPGVDRMTVARWYTWHDGAWTLYREQLVPRPYGAAGPSPNAVYACRDGTFRGYWESNVAMESVDTDYTGHPCDNPSPAHRIKTERRTWDVYARPWSIVQLAHLDGWARASGLALAGGDIGPVEESPTTGISKQSAYTAYAWENIHVGTTFTYWRTDERAIDIPMAYKVCVDGSDTGLRTKEAGETSQFSGRSDSVAEWVPDPLGVDGYGYQFSTTFSFTQYEHHDGVVVLGCSAGGWLTLLEGARIRIPSEMSPMEFSGLHHSSTWNPPCPALLDVFEGSRITEVSVDNQDIVWPQALGGFHSIGGSWSTVDQESGDTWTGIRYRRTAEGDPLTVRVFYNGIDRTAAVEACCGRPVDELQAIYWRA